MLRLGSTSYRITNAPSPASFLPGTLPRRNIGRACLGRAIAVLGLDQARTGRTLIRPRLAGLSNMRSPAPQHRARRIIGHGQAVWEHVAKWFPMARRIEYSVASKTALVTKAQNVFREGRIEFDNKWTDLMAALMAIRPALTGSQRGVTYISKRNGEIGHADIAWALLNALSNEPMDVSVAEAGHGGIVRFSK